MNRIPYIFAVLLGTLLLYACGPSRYMLDLEMRQVSRAGVDLTGKNVTIVYGQDGETSKHDQILESMAKGMALSLKERYQDSMGEVKASALRGASDYANRDSLLNLLVRTGADLVFLLDKVTVQSSTVSFILKCYDGMNQEDKVQLFSGNCVLDSTQGLEAGKEIASAFEPQWKHEQYSLYYFDSAVWYDAIIKAESFDWKGAMDIWLNQLKTNNVLKRSCASYNIATACYMLGDYDLAAKWLDSSENDADLVVSEGLRKRINARK